MGVSPHCPSTDVVMRWWWWMRGSVFQRLTQCRRRKAAVSRPRTTQRQTTSFSLKRNKEQRTSRTENGLCSQLTTAAGLFFIIRPLSPPSLAIHYNQPMQKYEAGNIHHLIYREPWRKLDTLTEAQTLHSLHSLPHSMNPLSHHTSACLWHLCLDERNTF